MKSWKLLSCVFVCAAMAAQPVIRENGVRSAAPAKAGVLAQGSAFVVLGQGLGPDEAVRGEIPYGKELAGTRVRFAPENGEAVEAFLIEAGASRIEGIVPSTLKAGKYKVSVLKDGESSDEAEVEVSARNAGLATLGGVSGGLAAGRVKRGEAWREITLASPARPGDEVELEMAGLGPIEAADNENPPEAGLADPAALVIGGNVEAEATYLGRNPAKPGYDLVRARLPEEGLPLGCGASVQVRIGDKTTRRALLPLGARDSNGACEHPLGWSEDRLREMLEGSPVTVASAALSSTTILFPGLEDEEEAPAKELKTEVFTAEFLRLRLADFAPGLEQDMSGIFISRRGCMVILDEEEGEDEAGDGELLDAGQELALTGPGGLAEKAKKAAESLVYQVQLSAPPIPGIPGFPIPGIPGGDQKERIVAGKYRLAGPGGADVDAFETELEIRGVFEWLDRAKVKEVDRGAGLLLKWKDATEAEDVVVVGTSTGPAPEDEAKKVTRSFVCVAPGDAGEIEVPAEILSKLPASEIDEEEEIPAGALMLTQTNRTNAYPFRPPLKQGGAMDAGEFSFWKSFVKPGVKFR